MTRKSPQSHPTTPIGWPTSKNHVAAARQRAVLAANAELIALYWQIGHDLLQRQRSVNWGDKVLDRLANDLREAFPEMKGFSSRNLKYMRYFAENCPAQSIGQQPAAQLPWFHIVTLLTKLREADTREWYAVRAVAEGWSRTTLELHIRNRLHERQGQAVTNFDARLPALHSELAHETLKDPYLFDVLGVGDEAHEREIENALMRHITRFLLELGSGFAFIGRQFRLEVSGKEFFADLLFIVAGSVCSANKEPRT
jgi:predicted nuclease of restriction endonuclease-like (RecB) superfamily